MIPDNKSGPPLGGAPGYGGPSEGVVGNQGSSAQPSGQKQDKQANQPPEPAQGGRDQGGETASTGEGTVILKEELPPEEKGTSLDEGGAG